MDDQSIASEEKCGFKASAHRSDDVGSGLLIPQSSTLFASSSRSQLPDHPFLPDAFQQKNLPKDIQLLIVYYVDFPVSACRLAQTCKHFRTLVDNHPKWGQLA